MDEKNIINLLKSEDTIDVVSAENEVVSRINSDQVSGAFADLLYQIFIPFLLSPHYKIRSNASTIMLMLLRNYSDSISAIGSALSNVAASLYSVNKQIAENSMESLQIILDNTENSFYWPVIKMIITDKKSTAVRLKVLSILPKYADFIPIPPIMKLLDDPQTQIRYAAIDIMEATSDHQRIAIAYRKVNISFEATKLLQQYFNLNESLSTLTDKIDRIDNVSESQFYSYTSRIRNQSLEDSKIKEYFSASKNLSGAKSLSQSRNKTPTRSRLENSQQSKNQSYTEILSRSLHRDDYSAKSNKSKSSQKSSKSNSSKKGNSLHDVSDNANKLQRGNQSSAKNVKNSQKRIQQGVVIAEEFKPDDNIEPTFTDDLDDPTRKTEYFGTVLDLANLSHIDPFIDGGNTEVKADGSTMEKLFLSDASDTDDWQTIMAATASNNNLNLINKMRKQLYQKSLNENSSSFAPSPLAYLHSTAYSEKNDSKGPKITETDEVKSAKSFGNPKPNLLHKSEKTSSHGSNKLMADLIAEDDKATDANASSKQRSRKSKSDRSINTNNSDHLQNSFSNESDNYISPFHSSDSLSESSNGARKSIIDDNIIRSKDRTQIHTEREKIQLSSPPPYHSPSSTSKMYTKSSKAASTASQNKEIILPTPELIQSIDNDEYEKKRNSRIGYTSSQRKKRRALKIVDMNGATWLERLSYLQAIEDAIVSDDIDPKENNPLDILDCILSAAYPFNQRVAQTVPNVLKEIIIRYPEIIKERSIEIVKIVLVSFQLEEIIPLFDTLLLEYDTNDFISAILQINDDSHQPLPSDSLILKIIKESDSKPSLSYSTVCRILTLCIHKIETSKTTNLISKELLYTIAVNYTEYTQKYGSKQTASTKRILAPYVKTAMQESQRMSSTMTQKTSSANQTKQDLNQTDSTTAKKESNLTIISNEMKKGANCNFAALSNAIEKINIPSQRHLIKLFESFLVFIGGKKITEEILKNHEEEITVICTSKFIYPFLLEYAMTPSVLPNVIIGLSNCIWNCPESFFEGSDKYYSTLYQQFKKSDGFTRQKIIKIFMAIQEVTLVPVSNTQSINPAHTKLITDMMNKFASDLSCL